MKSNRQKIVLKRIMFFFFFHLKEFFLLFLQFATLSSTGLELQTTLSIASSRVAKFKIIKNGNPGLSSSSEIEARIQIEEEKN